jgi:hypothetical protein
LLGSTTFVLLGFALKGSASSSSLEEESDELDF